jgi:hypothetical protein
MTAIRLKLEVTLFVDDHAVDVTSESLINHMWNWKQHGVLRDARKDTKYETIAVYQENKEWAKIRNG